MKFEVRDPVYGFVKFNEWEKEIIAHPSIQRLRRIRQLGLTDMVYPGATHTRFEHSLGVMRLITRMYDSIIGNEENRRILRDNLDYEEAGFKRDRQIVRLAGLLHDLGHPPFSHASEELMQTNPTTGRQYKHEDYTVSIINGPLKQVIEDHPLNQNYGIQSEEIADLIIGNPKRLKGRLFWKVLISSQLDADRCDYLLRDSLHAGVKYGIYDLERLVVTLGLGVDPETGDVVLGVRKGGWHIAESLLISRYHMFTQVYCHKTRRAYDYLLQQALKQAIVQLPSPKDIQDFLMIDDYSAWELMRQEAQDELTRIINRDHPRVLYETRGLCIQSEEQDRLSRLKSKLSANGIWYWEDSLREMNTWYGLENEEIQVIQKEEGRIYPLSTYSPIVEALQGKYAKTRIYVNASDLERARDTGGL